MAKSLLEQAREAAQGFASKFNKPISARGIGRREPLITPQRVRAPIRAKGIGSRTSRQELERKAVAKGLIFPRSVREDPEKLRTEIRRRRTPTAEAKTLRTIGATLDAPSSFLGGIIGAPEGATDRLRTGGRAVIERFKGDTSSTLFETVPGKLGLTGVPAVGVGLLAEIGIPGVEDIGKLGKVPRIVKSLDKAQDTGKVAKSVFQSVDQKTGKKIFKVINSKDFDDFKDLVDGGDLFGGIAGKDFGGKSFHLTAKTPSQMLERGFKFGGEATIDEVLDLKGIADRLPRLTTKGPTPFAALKDKARAEFLDRLAPIQDFAKEASGKIGRETNVYRTFRNQAGNSGKIEAFIERNFTPILTREGDRLGDLEELMRLQRTVEKGSQGFKTAVSPEQAAKALNKIRTKLGDKQFDSLITSAEEFRGVGNKLLKMTRDAGIISNRSYEQILAKNQFYVPFETLEAVSDAAERSDFARASFNVASQDVVKAFKGGEGEVGDVIESMIRKSGKTILLAEKNAAMRELVEVGLESGLVTKLDGAVPKGKGAVNLFVDGENVRFSVPEELEVAIKNLDGKTSGLAAKILKVPADILRLGATGLNVAFIPRNIVRDLSDAAFGEASEGALKGMGEFLQSYPRGFAAALKRTDDYYDWLRAGGGGSTQIAAEVLRRPKKTVARLAGKGSKINKVLSAPKDLIEFVGRVGEESTRVSRFIRGVKKGEAPAEAAFKSRDITVDFARAGNSTRVLNQFVPFLNAQVQGVDRMVRLFKQNPKRASVAATSLIGIPTTIAYLHNRKFQDFKDLADFEKENSWIVMARDRTPEEKARGDNLKAVKIPKGNVARPMSNIIENFYAFLDDKGDQSVGQLAAQVGLDTLEDLSPIGIPVGSDRFRRFAGGVVPQAVRPLVEQAANVNLFTGAPIIPRSLEGIEPEEQFKETTPKSAVAVGKALGISPLRVEAFTKGTFAGVGKQALEPSKVPSEVARGFFGPRGGQQEREQRVGLRQLETDVATEKKKAERVLQAGIKSGNLKTALSKAKKSGGLTAEGFAHINKPKNIAKVISSESSKMKSEEKRAFLSELKASGVLTKKVFEELTKVERLGSFERSLKGSTVAARSRFIAQELKRLKTAEEKRELLADLKDKRILTESVFKKLREEGIL